MTLESAIDRLKSGFMSLQDYFQAVKSGQLEPWVSDNPDVRGQHPHHPLNFDNRTIRIAGSQGVLEFAQLQGELFTPRILEDIHVHLFDCSSEVRRFLISALYYVGDGRSLQHLRHLLELESVESSEAGDMDWIRDVADILTRRLAPPRASSLDTVFVVSPDIRLIINIRDFCESNGMKLWIGKPNSPDVIAVPYKIAIIDKDWLGEKAWDDWMEFLTEAKGAEQEYQVIIIPDPDVSDQERTDVEKQFVDLEKTVWFVAGGENSEIAIILNRVVFS